MNKQHAIDLVRDTFESPFRRDHFANFIGRLLNQIELDPFTYTGSFIPDAFHNYVSKYERLGKYTDDQGRRVDVLVVYLKRDTAVERARATQRRFIAGYLQGKYGSDVDKDAALVAFVSAENMDDWRFSLVKLETRLVATAKGVTKAVDEFTPARRWSFLVGANEKSHTAQTRFVPIMQETERNPTLAQLEEAFNIEKVTREFFEKYRDLFIRTKAELDKAVAANPKARADLAAKGVDTVNLAKKLLGQIVFLYYLQKKGWFGVPRDGAWGEGSKQFLRELFNGAHGPYANFFNDILEPLFYEALRIDRGHDDHYYSRFNCRIPFLNGGLFDPMGNYDWVHADILLPNDLFSNQNKTKEGDTGNGILDIFDRYNFTVREDEPFEKEVAIDPELLGKAYEKFNAIRPDNYAEFVRVLGSGRKGEESKFNKQYGVYYTPREIVHYMCRHSLIHYLATSLDGQASQADITALIERGEDWRENDARVIKEGRETDTYPFAAPPAIRANAALLDEKLAAITVCDPAVGSGAFPVGMMSEIVRARGTLTTYLPDLRSDRSPYAFKRACIEHALYGVDIDPGAVEIAKLRLWLSLIVEEEDIRRIKPLPNLDYKIVCGNSLIGFPDSYQTAIGQEISDLMRQHFNETNVTRKNELKAAIDAKIESRYANSRRVLGYMVNFDFKTVFADVFQQNGGFDLVIANPPYVRQEEIKTLKPTLQKQFACYTGTADLFVYFFEKGVRLLRDNGLLTFICSNKYFRSGYGQKLRRFLGSQTRVRQIIDFGDAPIFEAIAYPSILLTQKAEPDDNAFKALTWARGEPLERFDEVLATRFFTMRQRDLGADGWRLEQKEVLALLAKLRRAGTPLGEYVRGRFYYGIKTGLNEAFVVDRATRDRLIAAHPSSVEILKPFLRGRDVKRWQVFSQDLWLIFTRRGIKIDEYPSIKKHLLQYKEQLMPKPKNWRGPWPGRKVGSYEWFEIQDNIAYWQEFEQPKIIIPAITQNAEYALDMRSFYGNDKTSICVSDDVHYLSGLLNSKLLWWYIQQVAASRQGGFYEFKPMYVTAIPIAETNDKCPVETLVRQILSARQANPQADVSAWEAEIDRLVYALYGLTEAEIAIVERRGH